MILAVDTYYFDQKAKTACIAFEQWTDNVPFKIYTEILENVADYTSGEFYKRELPCILSILKQVEFDTIEAIVVDGFVYLDNAQKPGLGAYLYKALESKVPVIGVAKTNFATVEKDKQLLLRGNSKSPLYITAVDMDIHVAAQHIKNMHGEHRMPTLLKQVDTLTKTKNA